MKKAKYGLRKTSTFKRDYKRMIKRGRDMRLIDTVIDLLALGEDRRKNIATMLWSETGKDTENVIFNRIGCLSTSVAMMFLSLNYLALGRIATFSTNNLLKMPIREDEHFFLQLYVIVDPRELRFTPVRRQHKTLRPRRQKS